MLYAGRQADAHITVKLEEDMHKLKGKMSVAKYRADLKDKIESIKQKSEQQESEYTSESRHLSASFYRPPASFISVIELKSNWMLYNENLKITIRKPLKGR